MMNATQEHFESWAILELMGHQKMAGLVSETNIAGKGFLRIDVYDEKGESVLFTRMVSPDSVYAINPVEREIALTIGAQSHRPVQSYEVRRLIGDGKQMLDAVPDYEYDDEPDDDWGDPKEEEG